MEYSSEDLLTRERERESRLSREGGCEPGFHPRTCVCSCPSWFLDRQKDWLLKDCSGIALK